MNFYRGRIRGVDMGRCLAKLRGNARLANYPPAALTYKCTGKPVHRCASLRLQFAEYALNSFIYRERARLFAKYAARRGRSCITMRREDCGHRKNQTNDPHVLAPGRPGLIIPSTYRASSCRTLTLLRIDCAPRAATICQSADRLIAGRPAFRDTTGTHRK